MYYYLTVSYDIHDLALDEESVLFGPFPTAEAREIALDEDLEERDLETGEIVNITLLETKADGSLVSTKSYLASEAEVLEDVEED